MGGCTNSKYAVDEDNQVKKEKKPFLSKKSKNKKDPVTTATSGIVDQTDAAVAVVETLATADQPQPQNPEILVDEAKSEHEVDDSAPKAEKEDIEFIDREEAEKQAAASAAAAASSSTTVTSSSDTNDAKKEVTTYQTTVVKHTQKEGDELLQHLKDEAFKTLQSSLRHLNQNRTHTTTASSSLNQSPETSTDDSTQDLLEQIKTQVLSSLGKTNEHVIVAVLDTGASLIKENKVKSMNELEDELVKAYPDSGDLCKKVINSTTGFLTAKGTEAGVILSNILANVNSGIQGIMNETEKTTVKVTRTVTEQVLSGGQLKEITKIITSNESMGSSNVPSFDDIIKNLSSDSKVVKSGSVVTSVSTSVNENHELVNDELANRAEKVVSQVVSAAVEKMHESDKAVTNGYHKLEEDIDESVLEENIKVEEESTVTTSTTKIVLNGSCSNGLDQIQNEFYKNGKHAAEIIVKNFEKNEHEIEAAEN